MKKAHLSFVTLLSIFSTAAFSAPSSNIHLEVLPMGTFTSITALDNGQPMKNKDIILTGRYTNEVYTTNSSGVVYISNVSHENKAYTAKLVGENGKLVSQNIVFTAQDKEHR